MKKNKNSDGFTLIEIIAVIIILGILSAVAIPKFFSMQEDAKIAALHGGLSESAARFNHAYSKYILVEKKAPSDVVGVLDKEQYLGVNAGTTGTDIGDFIVKWNKQSDGSLKIEVVAAGTIGAASLFSMPVETKTKIISGITWGN